MVMPCLPFGAPVVVTTVLVGTVLVGTVVVTRAGSAGRRRRVRVRGPAGASRSRDHHTERQQDR